MAVVRGFGVMCVGDICAENYCFNTNFMTKGIFHQKGAQNRHDIFLFWILLSIQGILRKIHFHKYKFFKHKEDRVVQNGKTLKLAGHPENKYIYLFSIGFTTINIYGRMLI